MLRAQVMMFAMFPKLPSLPTLRMPQVGLTPTGADFGLAEVPLKNEVVELDAFWSCDNNGF